MTTYTTINEAFKNGTGDVFFIKDDRFVAVSRHAIPFEQMEAEGFKYLTYSETIKIAGTQEVKKAPIVEQPIQVLSKRKVCINQGSYYPGFFGGFYEEYPDAYGQNL
jgi:hypothetical protein